LKPQERLCIALRLAYNHLGFYPPESNKNFIKVFLSPLTGERFHDSQSLVSALKTSIGSPLLNGFTPLQAREDYTYKVKQIANVKDYSTLKPLYRQILQLFFDAYYASKEKHSLSSRHELSICRLLVPTFVFLLHIHTNTEDYDKDDYGSIKIAPDYFYFLEAQIDASHRFFDENLDSFWERLLTPNVIATEQISLRERVFLDGSTLLTRGVEANKRGSGKYATVYDCKMPYSKTTVAIKKFNNKKFTLETFLNEANIHAHLGSSPYIVTFFGYSIGRQIIVMESCERSLESLLFPPKTQESPSESPIDDITRLDYAHQLGKGLEYIASKRIIHRDIKCANVLLEKDGLKFCDFGLSTRPPEGETQLETNDPKGSPLYMAPEALFKNTNQKMVFSEKTDVFALSFLLWELDSGEKAHLTYETQDLPVFLKAMSTDDVRPDPNRALNFFPLLANAWHTDPAQRSSASQLSKSLTALFDSKKRAMSAQNAANGTAASATPATTVTSTTTSPLSP